MPQNARLLDAVLSPRGYRVITAQSGEEALRRLDEEPPDIVLLDIFMPGLDGYEVCRRIRQQPETAFLPVVMITASGDQEKRRAIEAGADDFVTKPFDQAELLARITSLIRIKRYHDTIEQQAQGVGRPGTSNSSSGSARRSRSWNDSAGCGGSSRPSSPSSSSTPAISPSWTVTAGRSWWCSATCAGSPRSPRSPSPRR
jgi:DNA-binding response OmpR family regulator